MFLSKILCMHPVFTKVPEATGVANPLPCLIEERNEK